VDELDLQVEVMTIADYRALLVDAAARSRFRVLCADGLTASPRVVVALLDMVEELLADDNDN